jgi:enediyne polyketide synthase
MAQAATALRELDGPVEFSGVEILRPVTVPPNTTRTIRLAALRRRDGGVDVALRSDETGFAADHFRACVRPAIAAGVGSAMDQRKGRSVAPHVVYERLLFHGPRFRRLAGYRMLAARSCVAEVATEGEAHWFGEYLPQDLLLGDPGARDCFVHALQACIPHVRVLPVAVRRITTSAAFGRGPLVVSGRERAVDAETFTWDVVVRGADGRECERWDGLVLRRVADLPGLAESPAALVATYLERRLHDLASAAVDVELSPGRSSDDAITGMLGRDAVITRRPDGKPEARDRSVSAAHIDGYTLAIASRSLVTCDAEEVAARAWDDLLGSDRLALAGRVASELGEQIDASATRVWAAVECTRKADLPSGESLTLSESTPDGWAVIRAGRTPVATWTGSVSGIDSAVAFAFLLGEQR